jgi:hypothetical protein
LLTGIANDEAFQTCKPIRISFRSGSMLHLQYRLELGIVPPQQLKACCMPFNEKLKDKCSIFSTGKS